MNVANLNIRPEAEAIFISLVAVVILISSNGCNITNHMIKKTDNTYRKLGTTNWTYEQDSSTIFWRKVGTGNKNLLLIHGFGPLTAMHWEEMVMQLHNEFTIFIPDLLYFGNSSSNSNNYDPRFIADLLFESLQKLNIGMIGQNIDDIFVAGHSYGGMIASIFAHRYPTITKGLVLINALSKYAENQHFDSLAYHFGFDNINDILIPSDGKSLKALFDVTFYKSKKYPAWMLNRPAHVLYANQTHEKQELLKFLRFHENEMKNMDLSYPGKVDIIWGDKDILIPPKNAYQLNEYYANSELTILPDVGHAANMEAAEEVSEVLKEYLVE